MGSTFRDRLECNGVKVKNVPNKEFIDGEFRFADYVEKDTEMWAMGPENPEEVDVEVVAEEMYKRYEYLSSKFDAVTLIRLEEDEKYWAEVVVEIPNDPSEQERLAEPLSEAIRQ